MTNRLVLHNLVARRCKILCLKLIKNRTCILGLEAKARPCQNRFPAFTCKTNSLDNVFLYFKFNCSLPICHYKCNVHFIFWTLNQLCVSVPSSSLSWKPVLMRVPEKSGDAWPPPRTHNPAVFSSLSLKPQWLCVIAKVRASFMMGGGEPHKGQFTSRFECPCLFDITKKYILFFMKWRLISVALKFSQMFNLLSV